MKTEDTFPTLSEEERLWRQGYAAVVGIDEAGRGALAGPVMAGAVILSPGSNYAGIWASVKDSKLLSAKARTQMAVQIRQMALSWGVGSASAQEIDQWGIAPATRLAMSRAVANLSSPPDYLLIDWVRLEQLNVPQQSFIKGDRRIVSIAAASILAKTSRDSEMISLHERYPLYGFDKHKGYGARFHLEALERAGPCPEHRHSFAPIRNKSTLFDP